MICAYFDRKCVPECMAYENGNCSRITSNEIRVYHDGTIDLINEVGIHESSNTLNVSIEAENSNYNYEQE